MRYCTNCNAPIDDNAAYCTQCSALQNPQAPKANLHSDALERYRRSTNNRTLTAALLIVGIAFACFFAAIAFTNIAPLCWDLDWFWYVVGIILYFVAAILSLVAGGCLCSYFSKRQ